MEDKGWLSWWYKIPRGVKAVGGCFAFLGICAFSCALLGLGWTLLPGAMEAVTQDSASQVDEPKEGYMFLGLCLGGDYCDTDEPTAREEDDGAPIVEATDEAPPAEEGAPVDCADAGLNASEPCEGGIVELAIELPSDVDLWSGEFTVVDTISDNPDWAADNFAIPWPPHMEIDREKCPKLNDVEVWCTFESRPGAFVIWTANGISTPAGTYEGCVGGWFYNPTDEQITIMFNDFKAQYSEAVDIARAEDEQTLDVDTMARYLLLRVTSTNPCDSSAYLGQVPLYAGQPLLDLDNLPYPED